MNSNEIDIQSPRLSSVGPNTAQELESLITEEDHESSSLWLGSFDGDDDGPMDRPLNGRVAQSRWLRLRRRIAKFGKFVGPGFMISVAYIDPGNYSTDITAGASYRFQLLSVVLMSNLIAVFLQSLSIQLGTVSGLNLAEACRLFLPRWLNLFLYILAEVAIIATDVAEVIGTAVALNLLIPQIPLVAGCALSVLDVMVILFFYRPDQSMKGLRAFEVFVTGLVLSVVICFCVQLSMITDTTLGEVLRGYLPSKALLEKQGLYQACGILGATVMPHSLYLGSGIVQPRLREHDDQCGLLPQTTASAASLTSDGRISTKKVFYIPSLTAIQHNLRYSIIELAITLLTFATFVNSAILIVAGAALYNNPDAVNADLYGMYDLLSRTLSPGAGTVFALALLLSGISAGIVCTIAGQMVSEGALNWTLKPWLRRLVTRTIAILPSIAIAALLGRTGLEDALNGSQVVLSVVLPFVSAPLIYFTCVDRYMTVRQGPARFHVETDKEGYFAAWRAGTGVKMANGWWITALGVLIWLVIAAMNVANAIWLGLSWT